MLNLDGVVVSIILCITDSLIKLLIAFSALSTYILGASKYVFHNNGTSNCCISGRASISCCISFDAITISPIFKLGFMAPATPVKISSQILKIFTNVAAVAEAATLPQRENTITDFIPFIVLEV